MKSAQKTQPSTLTPAQVAGLIVGRAMRTIAGIRKITGKGFASAVADVASYARCTAEEATQAVRGEESAMWAAAKGAHAAHGEVVSISTGTNRSGFDSTEKRRTALTSAQAADVARDAKASKTAKAERAAKAAKTLSDALEAARAAGYQAGFTRVAFISKASAKVAA